MSLTKTINDLLNKYATELFKSVVEEYGERYSKDTKILYDIWNSTTKDNLPIEIKFGSSQNKECEKEIIINKNGSLVMVIRNWLQNSESLFNN